MPKTRDILNQTFGNFTVIERLPSENKKTYWLCKCNICGAQIKKQTCTIVKRTINECHCHLSGGQLRFCLNCNTELTTKSQKKYCSNKCQREYERNNIVQRINNGELSGINEYGKVKDAIRTYLFLKYNNSCSNCGWSGVNPITKKVPLEVHHKDGDKTNNHESNLELLCPNCHSLTSNFRFLNSKTHKKKL